MSKSKYLERKLPSAIYPVVIDLLASYASDIVSCKSDEYENSTVSLQPLPEFIKQVSIMNINFIFFYYILKNREINIFIILYIFLLYCIIIYKIKDIR